METRSTFLEKIVEPTVKHLGFELWGVEQTGTGRHKRVCIYIDAPNGISVDDCETVSQQVNVLLEVEDSFAGTYDLEVSSPGLDRLLFKPSHYESHLGERIDVRLHLPIDGSRRFRGRLRNCSGESISVELDDDMKVIPLTQVRRTRVVPDFE